MFHPEECTLSVKSRNSHLSQLQLSPSEEWSAWIWCNNCNRLDTPHLPFVAPKHSPIISNAIKSIVLCDLFFREIWICCPTATDLNCLADKNLVQQGLKSTISSSNHIYTLSTAMNRRPRLIGRQMSGLIHIQHNITQNGKWSKLLFRETQIKTFRRVCGSDLF